MSDVQDLTMVCDNPEKNLDGNWDERQDEYEDLEREDDSVIASLPASVDRNLDALAYSEDGSLYLGSSCITGRYWTGSAWCWKAPDLAPDVQLCTAGIETQTGISDLCYIGCDKIVLGEDSGGIELIELVTSGGRQYFNSKICIVEHDDSVTTVTCNSSKSLVGSGGTDCSIKIWDLESMICHSTLRQVHDDSITCVSFSRVSTEVLLSASLDGKVILWDFRTSQPAIRVCDVLCDKPLALDWKPTSEHYFTYGNESGHIITVDLRSPEKCLQGLQAHEKPIFRVEYSSKYDNLLATCADDNAVRVVKYVDSLPEIIYDSEDHNDFVRGLSWCPVTDRLTSCGWDKQVLHHSVPVKS